MSASCIIGNFNGKQRHHGKGKYPTRGYRNIEVFYNETKEFLSGKLEKCKLKKTKHHILFGLTLDLMILDSNSNDEMYRNIKIIYGIIESRLK